VADVASFVPASNYGIQAVNPGAAIVQGIGSGLGIQEAQNQLSAQQLALEQQAQLQKDLTAFAAKPNPSADDYAGIMARHPQLADRFKASHDVMDAAQKSAQIKNAAPVYAALRGGKKDIAADLLEQQAVAFDNAGNKQAAQAARTMQQWIKIDPNSAMHAVGFSLAANDPDKFGDITNSLTTQAHTEATTPAEVKKLTAEADTARAEADNAPALQKAKVSDLNSQIKTRAGQLGLDTDRLESDNAARAAELARKPGAVDLPASALQIVNDSAQKAILSRQTAAQADDLAGQLEALGGGNGGFASAAEWLKKATGSQDYMTALRQEYVRLRSTEVMRNLPPGPASDKDIQLAMNGFPPETANSKQLAGFLRGLSKMQSLNAQVEDSKSEWVNQVGSLGRARADIQIGDAQIPAGTTFSDFQKRFLKPLGSQAKAGQSPVNAKGDLDDLLAKYGMAQ
jgi:hypothetical protein